jgi:hypothetical protein
MFSLVRVGARRVSSATQSARLGVFESLRATHSECGARVAALQRLRRIAAADAAARQRSVDGVGAAARTVCSARLQLAERPADLPPAMRAEAVPTTCGVRSLRSTQASAELEARAAVRRRRTGAARRLRRAGRWRRRRRQPGLDAHAGAHVLELGLQDAPLWHARGRACRRAGRPQVLRAAREPAATRTARSASRPACTGSCGCRPLTPKARAAGTRRLPRSTCFRRATRAPARRAAAAASRAPRRHVSRQRRGRPARQHDRQRRARHARANRHRGAVPVVALAAPEPRRGASSLLEARVAAHRAAEREKSEQAVARRARCADVWLELAWCARTRCIRASACRCARSNRAGTNACGALARRLSTGRVAARSGARRILSVDCRQSQRRRSQTIDSREPPFTAPELPTATIGVDPRVGQHGGES